MTFTDRDGATHPRRLLVISEGLEWRIAAIDPLNSKARAFSISSWQYKPDAKILSALLNCRRTCTKPIGLSSIVALTWRIRQRDYEHTTTRIFRRDLRPPDDDFERPAND